MNNQLPLINCVTCMDALELMRLIPAASVDLVLTDPPYGVHEATWDKSPELSRFWVEVKRILKPQSAVVITAVQPFTTDLIMSNRDWFKYTWVWVKSIPGDFFNAKNKPMRLHEDVLVFSNGTTANGSDNRMRYFPQGTTNVRKIHSRPYSAKFRRESEQIVSTRANWKTKYESEVSDYPNTVLAFAHGNNTTEHPNQKPLTLFEYLIRTYTEPDGLVVDPFCGSGTTAVAARNLNRRYIVGDSSPEYCAVAEKRLSQAYTPNMFEALQEAQGK